MGGALKMCSLCLPVLLVLALSALLRPASGSLGSPEVAYRADLASIGLDLSNAAYCQLNQITDWSCAPCERLKTRHAVEPIGTPIVIDGVVGGFGVVNDWGTRAVIAALSNNQIVVSFRGSANLTNWLEDFDFWGLVPFSMCPKCSVHEGFFKSWLSLERQVVDAVVKLHEQNPDSEILVTGHSLGAAQAVLAATELYYNSGLPVTQVYTYGQPRVGNAAFHHFYNNGTSRRQYTKPGASYRVVHYRDPVPQAPFRWMGFEHTSAEVWYNEDSSNFTVCDATGEDRSCSASLGFDLLAISDHTSYLDRPTGGDACSNS